MLFGRYKLFQQPAVGAVMSVLALALLGAAWWNQDGRLAQRATPQNLPLALLLCTVFVIANRYPVHVRFQTKIHIATVPLYLMVLLLPPPIAALAAGTGMLIEQWLSHDLSGNKPSDIAAAVGRLVIVALVCAWIAQFFFADYLETPLALVLVAVIMYIADTVLGAVEIAAMSTDSFGSLLLMLIREGWAVEGVQYLLGILGALVALRHPWALALLLPPVIFVYQAYKRAKEMQDTTRHMLENMADTVDLRDPYTGGHSRRVAELCRGILAELALRGPEADLIITAARVHDIGKIALPDHVLNKPGKLEPEEWAIMQSHAVRGAEFLARYPDFRRGVEIVRHHHERWDGKGYPDGLGGAAIPIGARVIAVADSFDAMTSDRPYRNGMTLHRAAQILRDERGMQWDAEIVDAFLRSIAERLAAEARASAAPPTPAVVHQGGAARQAG
jgi:HD-GYP domain-containing protein (c-di-GMP phosphodiesterase class II)